MFKEISMPDDQHQRLVEALLHPEPDPNGNVDADVIKMILAEVGGITPASHATEDEFCGVDFMSDGTAPTPEPDFIDDSAPAA